MILALDFGTKRTGLALSDGKVASEYATLETTDDLMERLAEICRRERITELVVGLPLSEDGQSNEQSRYVEAQVELLHEHLDLPISFEDEVLTTVEARRQLEAAGVSPDGIAERIDQASARLILEQYLAGRK